MGKHILRFLFFVISVVIVVALIVLANWVPTTFQRDTLRRYGSVEKLKAALNIKDVFVPAYFPQSIAWPPSDIVAQASPFVAVLMKFNRVNSNDEVLIITQSAREQFPREASIELTKITERGLQPLHGKNALLEVGACGKVEPCSRISWREGEYRLTLMMKATPFELIRIAGSMAH